MKKILVILLMCLFTMSVFAKGSISSGRSSSFGSRSSSSNIRVSKPAVTSTAFKLTPKSTPKIYESFKDRNSTPKITTAANVNQIFDRNTRTNKRTDFYSSYQRPVVYQQTIASHPNYGMWDAVLLWSLLDNVGDRQMYYNHQSEPSFQQWRQDANVLCQQGNKDICDKLASLDKEVNEQKTKGVKPDISYITPGVDPNIYTSTIANINDLSEIKICTGTASSDYSRFATQIENQTKLKIKLIPTNGSVDNLVKLSDGTCDMAFAQSDTIHSDELVSFLTLDTKEAVLLICNKDSKIKSSNDLSNKNVIYVGNDQSGSKFTLNTFIEKIKDFGTVAVNNTFSTIEASTRITSEKDSCLFVVDTVNAPYVNQLDKEGKSTLVEIDKELSSYTKMKISTGLYSNLDSNRGWLTFNINTLAVNPVLVTTKTFIESNPVIYFDVLTLNREVLKEKLQ